MGDPTNKTETLNSQNVPTSPPDTLNGAVNREPDYETNHTTDINTSSNAAHTSSEATDELTELRQLLIGGPPGDVLNSKLTPDDLSKVLPAALSKAYERRAGITLAAMPTVETAIQSSVQKDASILAEALFPVIGPATRKSITSAIGSLVQSLNQTLEHSLSLQSFKWRLEAKRTGKTFAEVVLIRTLIYQVEQIFLIHRETGLVIRHVVTDVATAQDPDLVSAMLTAIQDFVKDSFTVEAGRSLDTLQLGDFTLLIEDGPQAVLACVIRGTAPAELRNIVRSQLEKIHHSFGASLRTFDGDQGPFETIEPYLQDCFQAKFKGTRKKAKKQPLSPLKKKLIWCLAGVIIAGLGTWAFANWQSNRQWQQFVGSLQEQSGLVVVNEYKKGRTYYLQGLFDPLAEDPEVMLAATDINPNRVDMNWSPYLSLEADFLPNRTRALLSPPSTVSINLNRQGVLQVSGRASEQWIQWAKATSTRLEGITAWSDASLVSIERENLATLQSRIEYRRFAFAPGKAVLRSQKYEQTLNNQAEDVESLLQTAQTLGEEVTISIRGYGDQRGEAPLTLELGNTRANYLKRVLINQGVDASSLSAKGESLHSTRPGEDSTSGASTLDEEGAAAYFEVRF